MFTIEIFNHELNMRIERKEFDSKRDANKFVKDNCEKRGYNFFCKTDRSLECQKLY